MRDCPNKHVLVVKNDGEYSSASELEDTLALLAADHAGSEGCSEEHINAAEADRYERTNGEGGAKSAAHIVPNKVCHQRAFVSSDHRWR